MIPPNDKNGIANSGDPDQTAPLGADFVSMVNSYVIRKVLFNFTHFISLNIKLDSTSKG